VSLHGDGPNGHSTRSFAKRVIWIDEHNVGAQCHSQDCKYVAREERMIPNPTLLGLLFRNTKTEPCDLPYSVVIPMHNKRNDIQRTLASVFNQTRVPNHVIVVDDRSSDGSAELVEGLNYKLYLIRLEKNVGKSNAINEAIKYVNDPLILILDADTILARDYADLVMQGFSEDVVGVSGRVLSASNNSSCQKSRVVEYLFGQRVLKTFQAAIGGMWVLTGCATMWNTKWLKDGGGMPNNTLVEDLELSWRAQQTHRVNYIHNAICFTEDPSSLKDYVSQIYRWYSWRPALSFVDFMKLRKGLKAIIAWSIIDTFMACIFSVLLAYSLMAEKLDFVLIAVFIDWLVYASLSAYEGFRVGKFWDALEGLPHCMVLRYVNIAVLLVAFIKPKKKWY
jgi:cellulose synthase/poly-beta-1,6-N-acetylglucosamine synthase-like glycosyltransferase